MKKTITIFLAAFMIMVMSACSNQAPQSSSSNTEANSETKNETTVKPTENENTTAQASGSSDLQQEDTKKVLVAYFSCTGTTKTLAKYVSEGLGADLYEITPAVPYTSEDLNYSDDNSRSTKEMNDSNSRPEITGSVENMDQYDTVFIGYPIWWGEAPRIVSTFIESYDFSGKTIVPFCTSGGSGIGSSGTNLEALTSGATWISGQRFTGGTSKDEMISWINGLGLDVTAQ